MTSIPTVKAMTEYRTAVEDAEEAGELVRVAKEIDPLIEMAGVMYAVRNLPRVPALLFEKLKGFDVVRCCSMLFSDPYRMSRILGFPGTEVFDKASYFPALDNPIKPRVVNSGPCHENILSSSIDVERLIPPTHGSLGVEHRYYQPVVITKHPQTGAYNVSVYRSVVQGPNRVTTNWRWDQHGGLILGAARQTKVPIPVALCLGAPPAVYVAATTKLPYGYDELNFAGGLQGQPVEMVKCRTIDLTVPATCEIVIEGELRYPYERGSDGPWPEYAGYLGMNIQPPIMDITAITHRDGAINQVFVPGASRLYVALATEAVFFRHLRSLAGEFVVDARITPLTVCHHAIVQVTKNEAHHEGLQINVALSALGFMNTIDLVTLVDQDIDIYDLAQVDWAIATRCNPAKQVHILPKARTHQNNPIAGVREMQGEPIAKAKMIIDATIPWNYKVTEKGPGLTFFTKSQWPEVDLRRYFSPEECRRWLGS